MKRSKWIFLLSLALAAAWMTSARAASDSVTVSADWTHEACHRDGETAGERRGSKGAAVAGYLMGAVGAVYVVPFAFVTNPVLGAVSCVGIMVGSGKLASAGSAEPDSAEIGAVAGRDWACQNEFRTAYVATVKDRRQWIAGSAALAGIVSGVATLFWAWSHYE